MIIECTHCRSKYQYDEARFEGKPSKKIRCAKCQQVFEIQNPSHVAPAAAPSGEKTGIRTGEQTGVRKGTREEPLPPGAKIEESTASGPLPSMPRAEGTAAAKLPAGKRLSLAIINGPDSGDVFRMEKPRVVIGRSNADFILNDSESSRAHAAVEARDVMVILEDLGSTNGTLVDGEKISRAVELQNHGEFQIGATTIMLIVTDEA